MRADDPFPIQGLAALTLYFCMKIRDVVLRGMDSQLSEFTHVHREGRDQTHSMTRKVEAPNFTVALGVFQTPRNIDIQTRPNSLLIGGGIHRGSLHANNDLVELRLEAV